MEGPRLKKLCTTAFYILCLMVAVIYVTYHLYRLLTSDMVTVRATVHEHSDIATLSAYIARDEISVGSTGNYCVLYSVGNGTKLTAGSKVAEIYGSDKATVVSRITEIREEIALLEQAMKPATVDSLDSDSSIAYIALMKILSGGSLSVDAYSQELLLKGSAREHIFDRSVIETKLSSLKNEMNSLISFLGAPKEALYMSDGGYFFSQDDGYGSLFSASLAMDGTADEMMNAIDTYHRGGMASNVGCGVSTRFADWYFIIPVDSDDADEYIKGNSYELMLDEYAIKLKALLYDVRETLDGADTCLVFSVSDLPSAFSYERCTDVSIIKDTQKGYRIPTSAVRTLQDGSTGVYVLSGGVVLFRRVEIIKSTDSYCFIKSEEQYQQEIAEGRRTEAIFRSYGGADSFVGLFGEGTDVLIKTDEGSFRIDPAVDEEVTEYKYLAQDEFVIISGTGLYHGKIAA